MQLTMEECILLAPLRIRTSVRRTGCRHLGGGLAFLTSHFQWKGDKAVYLTPKFFVLGIFYSNARGLCGGMIEEWHNACSYRIRIIQSKTVACICCFCNKLLCGKVKNNVAMVLTSYLKENNKHFFI